MWATARRENGLLERPKTADALKDIMRYTVETNYGDSMFPGLTVCAKTGTGEIRRG